MNIKIFWLSIVAVIASFAGGFLLANSLNKKDLDALRSENENLRKTQAESERDKQEVTLSEDEIRRRIAEADSNPANIPFQKNLGFALYNYASMRQNTELLMEVSRLIGRVYTDNPNDYAAIVTLGNIYFDLGYFNKNSENINKAREFYQKALRQKPNDADVITDLGLTHLLAEPVDIEQAMLEFQKSLRIEPKNEKTLQAMIEALKKQDKPGEAERYITTLREINPDSQVLTNSNENDGEDDLRKQ
ncbi:MAG TPA: hypothetical protein VNI84_16680 [Pyrinomonadaceae bacterium]|nr:hypothetical protein [Pyrinomonadaceae bacterium]